MKAGVNSLLPIECVGRNEDHVRGRALQQHTIESAGKEVRLSVNEINLAQGIGHNTQLDPRSQISGGEHSVSSRRPVNRE